MGICKGDQLAAGFALGVAFALVSGAVLAWLCVRTYLDETPETRDQ
jgi:hypothetical protein